MSAYVSHCKALSKRQMSVKKIQEEMHEKQIFKRLTLRTPTSIKALRSSVTAWVMVMPITNPYMAMVAISHSCSWDASSPSAIAHCPTANTEYN